VYLHRIHSDHSVYHFHRRLYGWLLVRLQIPLTLAEGVIKLTTNPKLLLIVLMVFF